MFFKKDKFLDLNFPKEITILKTIYFIEVVFSKKKSSSVVVRNNKLIFRLSSYLSKSQALIHFNELLKKISKKQENSNPIFEKTINEILETGNFNFANEEYLVKYFNSRGIKLIENTFFINYKTKFELIEKKIIKLLCEKYYLRLKNYLIAKNLNSYNFKIKGFELKNLNSKWGHCTHDNKILLNLKLLNTELEVLDYVIFHELSHIKHKNHSKAFWLEVEKFCPNYKILRKVLKDSPPKIFN